MGLTVEENMKLKTDTVKKIIMVVDDDPIIRTIICSIIKRSRPGIDLIECENGEEAYNKMNEGIDLIFTDNNMPKVSGLEFIRKIKADEEYLNIPVVMVSVEDRDEYKFIGKELGVAGWVVKPFQNNQISEYINRFI